MAAFKFALSPTASETAKIRAAEELRKRFPGHDFEHVDYKTFHLPDYNILQTEGTLHAFGDQMVVTGDYDDKQLSKAVHAAFDELKTWKPS